MSLLGDMASKAMDVATAAAQSAAETALQVARDVVVSMRERIERSSVHTLPENTEPEADSAHDEDMDSVSGESAMATDDDTEHSIALK